MSRIAGALGRGDLVYRPDAALLAAARTASLLEDLLGSLSPAVLRGLLSGNPLVHRVMMVDHDDGRTDAPDIVGEMLIRKHLGEADLRQHGTHGPPFILAVIWNHVQSTKAILAKFPCQDEAFLLTNDFGQTALHKLAYYSVDGKFLIEIAPREAFLVQDGAGDTPLHVMCGRLAPPLLALAAERCPEALRLRNNTGHSAFVALLYREHFLVPCARALLPFCSASPLALRDQRGRTALHLLASFATPPEDLIYEVAMHMDTTDLRAPSADGCTVKQLLDATPKGAELAQRLLAPRQKRCIWLTPQAWLKSWLAYNTMSIRAT